jgi:hypothetical protein
MVNKDYITVTGYSNPVLCAMKALQYFNLNLNKQSFLNVAHIVGDIECKNGFEIKTTDDIRKLCSIGNFEIIMENNKFTAKINPTYQP